MSAADIFAQTDCELWLVTASAPPRQGGLIATFVSRASITPDFPRVVVGLAYYHHTAELIKASQAFGLHLLGDDNLDLVWRFGTCSGRDTDKFAGVEFRAGQTGSPIVNGVLGWLDCRVEAELDTGDRMLLLAEVVDAVLTSTARPLTGKRLGELASPDRMRQLKEQEAQDGALDAAAIRAWRRDTSDRSSGQVQEPTDEDGQWGG
jgi:flavin reductase (DIM6/NTAB) family NADH-FMN oxidoreductase RutF